LRNINRFFVALMEGEILPVPGQEVYANFFIDVFQSCFFVLCECKKIVYRFYLSLIFRNPQTPRAIPALLAMKYWPELLKEAFMQRRRKEIEEWYGQVLERAKNDPETRSDVDFMM